MPIRSGTADAVRGVAVGGRWRMLPTRVAAVAALSIRDTARHGRGPPRVGPMPLIHWLCLTWLGRCHLPLVPGHCICADLRCLNSTGRPRTRLLPFELRHTAALRVRLPLVTGLDPRRRARRGSGGNGRRAGPGSGPQPCSPRTDRGTTRGGRVGVRRRPRRETRTGWSLMVESAIGTA